jgi:hypothetical protein
MLTKSTGGVKPMSKSMPKSMWRRVARRPPPRCPPPDVFAIRFVRDFEPAARFVARDGSVFP